MPTYLKSSMPASSALPRRKRRKDTLASVVDPSATESALKTLGRNTLSGIGAVGSALDTYGGGGAIRDFLAGNNPVDQLADPFSEHKRTSGRDLLHSWGLASKNKETGLDFSDPLEFLQDAAGFATEVALDPLTYATFGLSALGKAGQVAKNAGILGRATEAASKLAGRAVGPRAARMTTTLGDLIGHAPESFDAVAQAAHAKGLKVRDIAGEKLGGLAGYHPPLARNPVGVLGGDRLMPVAEKLDRVGAKIRESAPVRSMYSLFGGSRRGTGSIVGQRLAEKASKGADEVEHLAAGETARTLQEIKDAGFFGNYGSIDEAHDAAYHALEGLGQVPNEIAPAVGRMQQHMQSVLQQAQEVGLKTGPLQDDYAEYFSRRKIARPGSSTEAANREAKAFGVSDSAANRRADILRDIPGGTGSLRQVARDSAAFIANMGPMTPRAARKAFGDWFAQTYANVIPDTYKVTKRGVATQFNGRLKRMSNWLLEQPIEDLKQGLFTDPFTAFQKRIGRGYDVAQTGRAILDTLADRVSMAKARSTTTGAGVRMVDVLRGAGFETATTRGANGLTALAERMGIANPSRKDLLRLGRSMVPRELAEDIVRTMDVFKSPESVGKVAKTVQSITNMFKAGVTGVWPGFHTRNLASGMVRNYAAGMVDRRSIFDAHRLLKGETIKRAAEIPIVKAMLTERGLPLTDEAATKIVGELAYSHRMSGRWAGQGITDFQGGYLQDADASLNAIPGQVPMTPMKDFAEGWTFRKGSKNPLNIRGVGDNEISTFAPVAGGEKLGEYVEGLNRIAPFLHQLKKGIDPAEAGRRVMDAHVDYSGKAFSAAERQYGTTAMPFYKFTSRQLPYMLRELTEHPGGATAQGIRAANDARDDSATTPDHVANTVAIPLGQTASGDKRYFTGLGLMEEQPLQFASLLRGNLQDPLRELGGQLNPLFKAPVEWATGESLFQAAPGGGRDLGELDPVLGRIGSNVKSMFTGEPEPPYRLPRGLEYLAANNPGSRLLQTVRTLTDRRKGLGVRANNILTGLRISDVSPAAQKSVLKDAIEATLREDGAKTFEGVYLDPNQQATPEQLALMQLLSDLRRESRGRRKTLKP